MTKVVRFGSWLLLALISVVVLLISLAVWAPQLTLKVVNGVQTSVVINAPSLELSMLPPTIRAQELNVRTATMEAQVSQLDAGIDLRAWWRNEPFWHAASKRTVVHTQPEPLVEDSDPAEGGSMPALNLRELLSFTRIALAEVEVTETLNIAVVADSNGGGASFDVRGEVAGQRLDLTGRLDDVQPDRVTLKLSGTSSFAKATSDAKAEIDLDGQLSVGETLSFSFNPSQVGLTGLTEESLALVLEAGSVHYNLAEDGLDVRALKGAMALGDETLPLEMQATLADVSRVPDGEVRARLAESRVEIEGRIDLAMLDAALNASINSDGVPKFLSIAPFQSEELFPLSAAFQLTLSGRTAEVEDLTLSTPTNQLNGTMSLAMSDPLKLHADINADALYVPIVSQAPDAATGEVPVAADNEADGTAVAGELQETAKEPAKEPEQESAPEAAPETVKEVAHEAVNAEADAAAEEVPAEALFSAAPIDWSWLERTDVQLNIKAQTLALGSAVFADFMLHGESEDGALLLKQWRAGDAERGFTGSAMLGLVPENRVQSEFSFTSSGLRMEEFGLLPDDELQGGDLQIDVHLTTRGQTAQDLAGGLAGNVRLSVEDAELANNVADMIGSDMVLEMLSKLNPFRQEDPATEISCALVSFDITDGVLVSDKQLVVETSKMEIVGDAKINLVSEDLDITFSPTAKAGVGLNVGSLVKFVKLGGKIRAPVPEVDALGLVASGAAVSAALSTGGLSVLAEGLAKRALTAGSACRPQADAVHPQPSLEEAQPGVDPISDSTANPSSVPDQEAAGEG